MFEIEEQIVKKIENFYHLISTKTMSLKIRKIFRISAKNVI